MKNHENISKKKKSMLKKVVWNGKGNNEKYIT